MSKPLVEIEGFATLDRLIKKLPDKVKHKEVVQILGQVANSTVAAARSYTPIASPLAMGGKTYARKRRQVRNVVVQQKYTAGLGRKSIGKKIMTRSRIPMLVVRANDKNIEGKKGYGGFYIRQWVIPGTVNFGGNPIMEKAYAVTKGKVLPDAEKKMSRYLQKKINKLS